MADERPAVGWSDPNWRKAERHRVMLLNLPPGALQRFARRGRSQLFAVAVLQVFVGVAVSLAVLRLVTGTWLPPYGAIVVLAVAVVTQAVFRAINSRAEQP